MNTGSLHLIAPKKPLNGIIKLPLSKSENNRILIIKALSTKPFEIKELSDANDTQLLNQCLHHISEGASTINAQDAGTVYRFLTAYMALKGKSSILTGTARMKERPIGVLVDALGQLGASITYLEKEGFPPLQFHESTLKGGEIKVKGNISSQYITALMLIGPKLKGGLHINIEGKLTSAPYVHMTAQQMLETGVKVLIKENTINIPEGNYTYNKAYEVEGDWSAASYWYSMVALCEGAEVKLLGLRKNSLQGDAVVSSIYESFGVNTEFKSDGILIKNKKQSINHFDYDFSSCPDLAQTVAVTMAAKGISGTLSGLHTLKIKETDRIAALETELKKLGVNIKSDSNAIRLQSSILNHQPIIIKTYHDHRMAMAFAPLSLVFKNGITIENPEVVKKSYPGFWEHLSGIKFEYQ